MTRGGFGQVAGPAVAVALIGIAAVLAHSGLQGTYGLVALRAAERLEIELGAELADVASERDALEAKARALGEGGPIDLDLLDARARAVLGLVRPDEIVIR